MNRIFSGMQPTRQLHLGNYLGALRNWVALQDSYECVYCVVDLHSLTLSQDPEVLRSNIREVAAAYIAAGVDPERNILFNQSYVSAHSELSWLLSCHTPLGWLNRMTQFKDKAGKQTSVSAGLFTYPVLMVGDILLYQTDIVPIGDDQRQHLELSRDVAERFNSRFGETFTVPKGVYPEAGARIMDLQEPENKMSTTGGNPQGTIYLLDPPEVVRKKVKTAVTDSGREIVHDTSEKAGVANLIEVMTVATGESIAEVEKRYEGAGYGQFKSDVGDAAAELLTPIQARYHELRDDPAELERMLALGAAKAREASAPTLEKMYERMGFTRPKGV